MVKIGITLGDPSGISPEVLLKSLDSLPEATYIIYGSKKILEKTSKLLNLKNPIVEIDSPESVDEKGFFLLNLYDRDFEPGKPSKKTGMAAITYLERAVDDVLQKKIDGIVTLPISKEFVMKAGFKYAGHTEFLAERSKSKDFCMVLMCEKIKVALITTHVPLKDVAHLIDRKKIVSKVKLINRELKEKFGIKNPKIAVLGLNPHAGDGGNIGDEEIKFIKPACEKLRREGVDVTGPISADTGFNRYKEFDIFIAMYHDQGLIPLKLLCFKRAVNITLGLPFIRTSPDHGTGFDIAGKGIADPSSFIEAVKLAYRLVLKTKDTCL